jgi:hypothetical protein
MTYTFVKPDLYANGKRPLMSGNKIDPDRTQ